MGEEKTETTEDGIKKVIKKKKMLVRKIKDEKT